MINRNIDDLLNINHTEFFQTTAREVIFYGGAGAGKSYSICDKILLQPLIQNKKLKIVIIRKTLPALKRTCMELIQQRAELFSIPYKLNISESRAVYANGSVILFQSMDHPECYEKIKSITDVDMIWFEELNELTEKAYDFALLRLRGGEGTYKQCISSLNPVSVTSWVFKRFFQEESPVKKIHTTISDNPFIDPAYIKALKDLKKSNLNLYKVYFLGEWGQLTGAVYDNYEIVEPFPDHFDEIIYGLDFGYNNPTALVKIGIYDQKIYLQEILYKNKLTNSELISILLNSKINKNDIIYCDSAEPQRIRELMKAGFNAKSSDKSIKINTQIDYVKSHRLFIDSNSYELQKEITGYVWKENKDGEKLDEPVKFNDHLMDAMRYAIFTHLGRRVKVDAPSTLKLQLREPRKSKVMNLPT